MSKKNSSSGFLVYFLEIVKAVIVALIVSLFLVLVAAFVIKFFNIDTKYIQIINQIIRTLSVFVACVTSLKYKGAGYVRGIIVGLLFGVLSYVIYSLLAGKFVLDITLLNNVVVCMVSGLISGIVSMVIRRN